jgi:hypothetical protein
LTTQKGVGFMLDIPSHFVFRFARSGTLQRWSSVLLAHKIITCLLVTKMIQRGWKEIMSLLVHSLWNLI